MFQKLSGGWLEIFIYVFVRALAATGLCLHYYRLLEEQTDGAELLEKIQLETE